MQAAAAATSGTNGPYVVATRSLWQLISALFYRVAAPGARGNAAVGSIVPPHSSNPDDLPISFGYKTAWIAVRSSDGRVLAESLGLKQIERCSWADGIDKAYKLRGVFVSPPIDEWTIAVGSLPEAGQDRFLPDLEEISRRFAHVFYFGTHRIVGYQAWAIAEKGHVRRAHAWLGERGEFLLNIGERTPEEVDLGTGLEDSENAPDEETVLELASRWVLDPRELDQHTEARGPGLIGTS